MISEIIVKKYFALLPLVECAKIIYKTLIKYPHDITKVDEEKGEMKNEWN